MPVRKIAAMIVEGGLALGIRCISRYTLHDPLSPPSLEIERLEIYEKNKTIF